MYPATTFRRHKVEVGFLNFGLNGSMKTPSRLEMNGFGEEDRERNIVLFRHIFWSKYKLGLHIRAVRLPNASYRGGKITSVSSIPEMKKQIQGTSWTHVFSPNATLIR